MEWANDFALIAVFVVLFPLLPLVGFGIAWLAAAITKPDVQTAPEDIPSETSETPNLYTKEVLETAALRRPLVKAWMEKDSPSYCYAVNNGIDTLELYQNAVKLVIGGKEAICHFAYAFDKQQPRVETVVADYADSTRRWFEGTPLKKPSFEMIANSVNGCLEEKNALAYLNEQAAEAMLGEEVFIPFSKFVEFGIEDIKDKEVTEAVKHVLITKNGFTTCTEKEDGLSLSLSMNEEEDD